MPDQIPLSPHPPPTPSSASSSRSKGGLPLLSLAPPALAIAEDISLADEGEERSARDIWHGEFTSYFDATGLDFLAITKASDLVKDGERLENLVWRLSWGQRRLPRKPSLSSFSVATGSSTSLNTPLHEHSPHDFPPLTNTPTSPCPSARSDRRTFGGALKLLLDEDVSFKDWVTDAKMLRIIPEISVPSVPDTPVANVEIRLVEPTPAPSRVGSLGGSLGAAGLLGAPAVPKTLREDKEGEEAAAEQEDEAIEEEEEYDPEGEIGHMSISKSTKTLPRSPRRKGKFFLHSSPSKGSGSDTSHTSPVAPITREIPSSANEPASPLQNLVLERRESGSSSASGVMMKSKKPKSRRPSSNAAATTAAAAVKAEANGDSSSTAPPPAKDKRHVSLSTMRGKFQSEKRKVAAAIATKEEDAAAAKDAEEEGSGWEDEDEEGEEEWSDEASDPPTKKSKIKSAKLQARRSSSRSRGSGHSTSNLDLNALLQRSKTKYSTPPGTSPRDPPRVPAPTPLKRMSKKERLKAQEERAKIEAELDAQQKREMFAKKQIFGGRPGEGLLSGMFKRGGSMVNLTEANESSSHPLRPSPTHGHLPSLSRSPIGPSLLMRSKSAAAMPLETGVSVTRISPQKSKLSEEIATPRSAESSQRRESGSPSRQTQPPRKGSAERQLPSGVDLETSDEDSADEDDYLATSAIHRKISELAAKKDARDAKAQAQVQVLPAPQAVPAGPAIPMQLDDNGVVQPLSPTTRRRAIIMREMSESLRRNLIIEREKSSTSRSGLRPTGRSNSFGHQPPHARPPPSTHTSVLPARGSTSNLAALDHPGGNHAQGQQPDQLHRHRSDPTLPAQGSGGEGRDPSPTGGGHRHGHGHGHGHHHHHHHHTSPSPEGGEGKPRHHAHFAPAPELVRRRTPPTVLGGGFLRPLTRVESPPIIRTQSSANLQLSRGNSPLSPPMLEAPPMQRSSTEGAHKVGGGNESDRREQQRRRELAARSRGGDTSYRSHGW